MMMPAVLQLSLPLRPAPAALAVLLPLVLCAPPHMTRWHLGPLVLTHLQMGLLMHGEPPHWQRLQAQVGPQQQQQQLVPLQKRRS
jgi:hypothetical protein